MMRHDELRTALYHRLYFLVPVVFHPMAPRFWRFVGWGGVFLYFVFIALILTLRYSILPHIENYRSDIERLASRGLGQTVSIGRIEANWKGINPDLDLFDVRVFDAQGRSALAFSRVEAILSWWSLPAGRLKLRSLRIDEPALNLRRDGEGRFFVAGIPVGEAQDDGDASDWLFDQRRIRIRGATLVWEDELRKAPPLILEDVNFALDNDGRRHRFGLTALPPKAMASMIDVRGDFHGSDPGEMARWSRRAYAEVAYADLAVWRQWIDYPVTLPHGRGGVRAWLDFSDGGLREITADLSLQEVSLRLARDLPLLELQSLSGRIGGKISADGFEVSGRNVELATRADSGKKNETSESHPAIYVKPTDFKVDWTRAGDVARTGSITASYFDIGVLSRLAEYLPFDAQSRQLLKDFSPHGRVSGLSAKWRGSKEKLDDYSLKAGFEELALKAKDYFPGFSGLTGKVEFDEKSGKVTLRSKKSGVNLPGVFPESAISLDKLDAQVGWKVRSGRVMVDLPHVDFAGPDADGSAQGTYITDGKGRGTIDLTATLTRGEARGVWRYMPHAVNASTRYWLRDSLLAGHASEAKLALKGDLTHFPFLDKSQGEFLVTVKAKDVTLDYGTGWPKITGIDGDLRFEGNGMTVDAHRGAILGAKLSATRAVIPDFDAPISNLRVTGKADGPTSEFLKFIDQSPVAERIDRFTEDMRARGDGHLELDLNIPLDSELLNESKIDGVFTFMNNDVLVDSALPWLKQVNGNVHFTGSDLQIPEIGAHFLGGALRIKGGAQKDGRVLIAIDGTVDIGQLRKQADSPVLANLSGATPYRGEIRINKRNSDLEIDSNLVGLASNLPPPFAKKSGEALPLSFEKTLLKMATGLGEVGAMSKGVKAKDAPVRDQISASLGKVLSMKVIRRKQKEGFVAERGAIAVGRPLQLPDAGVTFGMSAGQIDLDAWRKALNGGSSPESGASSSFPNIDVLNFKTPDLVLLGRHFNDVDLTASPKPPQWKIRLDSHQANGDLFWNGAGGGTVKGRLGRLKLDPATLPEGGATAEAGAAGGKLPAIDFVVENFSLGSRDLGHLELLASNEDGVWELHKILINNPGGKLTGSGQWLSSAGADHTQLAFQVESQDVGVLLERLGYPGTMRAGTAQASGKVGWNSRPVDVDFTSLNGEMEVEVEKGQFLKLNPGAAGKLLGLISLQGLPRRITLDFKDVFSKGFAFDSLSCKLKIENGLMRTDRLQIDGPAARVLMHGEVDLQHETQNLRVNVQPELGGTAALGVALVNPVAGVATWVAHKVLQNPLNHMFGFDYRVTGTWDDPKVEKLTSTSPQDVGPRLLTIPHQTGVENEPSRK